MENELDLSWTGRKVLPETTTLNLGASSRLTNLNELLAIVVMRQPGAFIVRPAEASL